MLELLLKVSALFALTVFSFGVVITTTVLIIKFL